MTATLQQLIDSLRNELQQYGEMLALLEAQQELVSHRETQPILNAISAMESQSVAIQAARLTRENLQKRLAWALGRAEGGAFCEIFPLLPEDYQPLVAALVEEINQLLERVRERAVRNQEQLRRSLELMERFINTLSPEVTSDRPTGEPNSLRTDQPPFAAVTV